MIYALWPCDSCLSCAEACDRHAEGRAGNIIKADVVAELDGSRVAAVLTADTAVELRVDGLAHSDGHLHELADAVLIKHGDGLLPKIWVS